MRAVGGLLIALGLLGLVGYFLLGGSFGFLSLMTPLALLGVGAVLRVAFPAPVPRPADEPSPDTHVRCPDCRELVRWDAVKCRHCGTALKPFAQPPGANGSDGGAQATFRAIGWIIAAVAVVALLSRIGG